MHQHFPDFQEKESKKKWTFQSKMQATANAANQNIESWKTWLS